MRPPRVVPLGDGALLVTFEAVIDVDMNRSVLSLAAHVRAQRMAGVRDVVPAYASCAVHFDPLRTDVARLESAISAAIDHAARADAPARAASTVHIPVCYGGPFGPDLAAVATFAGVPEEEVVRLHVEREYRVFMIGFLPGFPYLGPVDDRIAAPRRDAPRPVVHRGSVGLAGRQTGVYPIDSPGGWQIIGRTPLALFDPSTSAPARLTPGDSVRFVPIDADEFARAGARSA
jgi:inhibitor of KinA